MADCSHKPPCPDGTPTWHCAKRTEIERAVRQCTMERETGTKLLQKFGLPICRESETEKYNREELRRDKGRLW